jgi:hypothetical protein
MAEPMDIDHNGASVQEAPFESSVESSVKGEGDETPESTDVCPYLSKNLYHQANCYVERTSHCMLLYSLFKEIMLIL